MALTSHGHHIPGSPLEDYGSVSVARCGGVRMCKTCQNEARLYNTPESPSPSDAQPDLKEQFPMANAITTRIFMRRPFDVEAIQVTNENFEDVAEWCGGKIVTVTDSAVEDVETPIQRHISVDVARPLGRRQTEAYEGDWILHASQGFKVYANRPFQKNFVEKVPPAANTTSQEDVDKLRYELKLANDIAHERQIIIENLRREAPQELMVTDEPAVVTIQDSDEAVNVS